VRASTASVFTRAAAIAFVCDPRLPAQLREESAQRLRVVRDPAREQLQALLVESGNVRAPAMQIDADVDHGGLLSDPELAASA
jgi:hypothetical protein